MKKKQLVSHYNYKMDLIKTSVFTYANSLSTPSHHPCHSLFFSWDLLRSLSGIISGPGSFAVQFGDHLRSWIICGPVQYRFLSDHQNNNSHFHSSHFLSFLIFPASIRFFFSLFVTFSHLRNNKKVRSA